MNTMESKQVQAIRALESEVRIIVDPLPIATLGMYFFLASEAMFFVGLLGAFIVLQSASGQHQLFQRSSWMLNGVLGISSAALLGISTLTMVFGRKGQFIAVVCAVLFLALQAEQWGELLSRHTYVERQGSGLVILDGTVRRIAPGKAFYVNDVRQSDLPQSFDVHSITRFDIGSDSAITNEVHLQGDQIVQDATYGPSRNNYFAMFFLLSAAHVLHALVGIVAVLWFLVVRKTHAPGSLQIYWHFVNAVGVLTLIALYFV